MAACTLSYLGKAAAEKQQVPSTVPLPCTGFRGKELLSSPLMPTMLARALAVTGGIPHPVLASSIALVISIASRQGEVRMRNFLLSFEQFQDSPGLFKGHQEAMLLFEQSQRGHRLKWLKQQGPHGVA